MTTHPQPSAGYWQTVTVAAALAVFALYVWLAVSNPHVALLADDALYLLMADLYSPWRDATGPTYHYVRAVSHLPPVFPLYLGLLGGGADNIAAARVACAAAMTIACALVYLYALGRGCGRPTAAWVAVFVALAPATLIHVIDIWSEGLYLALSLAVLMYAAHIAKQPRSWPYLVLLGLLVACAIGTRTIGVALIPVVLWALRGAGWRTLAIVLGSLVVGHGLISVLAQTGGGESYAGQIAAAYGADPLAALRAQLSSSLSLLPSALSKVLIYQHAPTPWQSALLALALLAMLAGLVTEIRRRSAIAVYFVAYLGVVLLWPYPAILDRFVYPLLPILLLLIVRGSRTLSSRRWPSILAPAALTLAMMPALIGFSQRAMTPVPDPALADWRTTRYWLDPFRGPDPLSGIRGRAAYIDAARSVNSMVPVNACVYTTIVQMVVFWGRRAAYQPPSAQALAQPESLACQYFLAVADAGNRPPMYPLDLLGGTAETLATIRAPGADPAEGLVVAVLFRWPPTPTARTTPQPESQ